MNGLTKEKASMRLFLACFVMYLTVCMMKSNFPASIAFLVKDGTFSKTDSGLISAAFYLTYGLGSLMGGLADRFSPYKIITVGLIGSILANLTLCFTTSFLPVLMIWSLCGAVQFGFWPAICKMIAGVMIPEHRYKAGVYLVLCIGIGGILSYLLVNPLMKLGGWVGVFSFNTLLLGVMFLLWLVTEKQTCFLMEETTPQNTSAQVHQKKTGFFPLIFKSGLVFLLVVELLINVMNIGLKTWIPTMMVESYGISPTWANLQTMLIYIANLAGTFLLVKVIDRMKNEMWAKGVLIGLCLPLYVLVLFIGRIPQWSAVAAFVIATTILYSTTNVNVRVSTAIETYGYSATFTGVLNALGCFGIVLANGGFGIIADRMGWNAVTVVLVAACIFGAGLCLPAGFLWKKFKTKK